MTTQNQGPHAGYAETVGSQFIALGIAVVVVFAVALFVYWISRYLSAHAEPCPQIWRH